ncbi:MAG: NitT/TauT family transport system permease protein [Betaproteobacteria bacterium]|nr:NitT/TauT family transport system permease protein [Betaproteobacteria bacterium]
MTSRPSLFDPDSARAVFIGRLLLAVSVLLLWQLGAGHLFDIFFFGKPTLIAASIFNDLRDPGFYRDLGVTGMEFGMGYVIGGFAGIACGVLLARWRYMAKLADPFLQALNAVPRIALAPMLIVWFGIGMSSKVFLAATLVFFIMFFNTLSGIRSVSPALCSVAKIQGATQWQIFTKIMLPSASSWIFTGLKMSLPFALVGVILGEFMVSSVGLGYRLNAYATAYNTSAALGMIMIMMCLMMLLTWGANALDARLMGWRDGGGDGAAAALKA